MDFKTNMKLYNFIVILFLLLMGQANAKFISNKYTKSKNYVGMNYKIGTLGFGVDFVLNINKTLASRLSFNGYSQFRNLTIHDEKLNTDQKLNIKGALQSSSLLFDIHPWQNAFFFSYGAYYSQNKINANYKPVSGEIDLGDHKYPSMQVGSVDAIINLKHKINPYFGIGLNSVDSKDKWHFILDIGAIYINKPLATVHAKAAKGFEAMQPILNSESKIEEKKLNNDIKKFKVYPVISVGVGFKF